MYTIKVNYTTGSSFHTEECEEDIGLVWESEKLATAALNSLEEHYRAIVDSESSFRFTPNERKTLLKSIKSKRWFHEAKDRWEDSWKYHCMVEMDDGTKRNLPSMYIGYFETLRGAELVIENNKRTF